MASLDDDEEVVLPFVITYDTGRLPERGVAMRIGLFNKRRETCSPPVG